MPREKESMGQWLGRKALELVGVKTGEVDEERKRKAGQALDERKRRTNSGNRSVRQQLEEWEDEKK